MWKVGEKVSLWVEGEIRAIVTDSLGTRVEVLNKKTGAHCFVPPESIEPKLEDENKEGAAI